MGYYIKGFGLTPLTLQVARTNNSEIIEGITPRQAILNCLSFCQRKINEWASDNSPYAQNIKNEMNDAIIQLNQLLNNYP